MTYTPPDRYIYFHNGDVARCGFSRLAGNYVAYLLDEDGRDTGQVCAYWDEDDIITEEDHFIPTGQ